MTPKDYSGLLQKRIEQDFSRWFDEGKVSEQDLYRFLHMTKRAAETTGMTELVSFCAAHLQTLDEKSTAALPVRTLKKFITQMRGFFQGAEKADADADLLQEEKHIAAGSEFVLVIDDDAEFASFIKETLEYSGIQVVIALSGKKGIELFYTLQPNMVIMDMQLPDVSGFHVLNQIADEAHARHVPVTLVSTDTRLHNHIKAIEAGAMDFIEKPLNTALFVPYVKNRLSRHFRIIKAALTDELTGAGNRRQFDRAIAQFAAAAKKNGQPFTVALFDLDHFKKVNDQYGHPAGDDVLRRFSAVVQQTKRTADAFFRYGGEEFSLLLPNTSPQEAIRVIEQIREAFQKEAFHTSDHPPFHVTFSAGVAAVRVNADEAVNEADQALYQSKHNGRNQTTIYNAAASSGSVKEQLTIIIVDDNLLIRKMLHEEFKQWPQEDVAITIREYENGPSFLQSNWYRGDENYLILLDGVMPEMDGLEVLDIIRRDYPEENVIVSMLTARNNESDIVTALTNGADDYISKPFHPHEVTARMQRLTKRLFK